MTTFPEERIAMALSALPPILTTQQLAALLASILENYMDPLDEEGMTRLTKLAINMVFNRELDVQLDLSVGPEDGVH